MVSPFSRRDPVSFGEVGGAFIMSVRMPRLRLGKKEHNDRSSRRGKEQVRLKTSESEREERCTWRDVRVGDNPWS